MVSKEKIERLKKSIGLDLQHSHAPISGNNVSNNPNQGQVAQKSNPPVQNRQMQQSRPQGKHPFDHLQDQALHRDMRPKQAPGDQSFLQESPSLRDITQRPKKKKGEDTSLFVKIDRHMEINEQIKSTSEEMKKIVETIYLLSKAEKLKSEAIDKIEKRLKVFDETVDKMDKNLVAPKQFISPSIIPVKENSNTELDSLEGEIDKLKNQLNSL